MFTGDLGQVHPNFKEASGLGEPVGFASRIEEETAMGEELIAWIQAGDEHVLRGLQEMGEAGAVLWPSDDSPHE